MHSVLLFSLLSSPLQAASRRLGRLLAAGALAAGLALALSSPSAAFAPDPVRPAALSPQAAASDAKPQGRQAGKAAPQRTPRTAVPANGGADRPTSAKGSVWAVAVGVNVYDDGDDFHALRYSVHDAELFADTIERGADHLLLLTAPDRSAPHPPTRAAILQAIRDMGAKTAPNDQFWFFFAGHGLSKGGVSYLAPSDARLPDLDTCLSEADLLDALKGCRAKVRALALDACRCEWSRGGGEKPFHILIEDKNGASAARNIVFTACRMGQYANEFPDIQHGAFTYAFVTGMMGAAAEADRDTINLAQLKAYVDREMASRAPGQNPEFLPEARPDVVISARNPKLLATLTAMRPGAPRADRKPLGPFVVIVLDPQGGKRQDAAPVLARLRQTAVEAGCTVYNDEVAAEFLKMRQAGNDKALQQRYYLPYVLKVEYACSDPETGEIVGVKNVSAQVSLVVTLEDAERSIKFSLQDDAPGGGGTAPAAIKKAQKAVLEKILAARAMGADKNPMTLAERLKAALQPQNK